MQSIRRTSLQFSAAAAACMVIAAGATAVVTTCRRVVAALALFTAPDPQVPAVPRARICLTA